MNTETKVLLTINLEGGTLIKGEPEVRKYYLTKKELFPNQKFKDKSGEKIIKSGKYKYIPTKYNEVKQRIALCKDAYDYMTSSECPSWFKNKHDWQRLSRIKRLETHLARTCRHFNGKSFSYQIIED